MGENDVGSGPTAARETKCFCPMVELPHSAPRSQGLARARSGALRRLARARHCAPGPGPDASGSRRVVFVDGLRLLAALQMVQGHTLDAFLDESLRHGPVFRAWTFIRGLTSPAFLLTAGIAFALATAAPANARGGRRRRLGRALQLLGLGYLMHAPLGVLFGDPWEQAVQQALAVDVLQCIGVSLLVQEGICALLPARGARALAALSLAVLCFALGPWTEQLQPSGSLWPFWGYVTARGGSLFPLSPWAGFVFAGLAVGQGLLDQTGSPLARPAARLLLWALVAGSASWVLFWLLPASPARVSPAYALLKVGCVLGVAAALSAGLEGKRLPSWLQRLSSETLFLYVSHVLLLYAGHVGLGRLLGRSQSVGAALLWALLLLLVCSAGALGYRRVQQALRGRGGRGTPRHQPPSSPG